MEDRPNTIARLVRFCVSHSLLVTGLGLLVGVCCGLYAAIHLGIDTDTSRILSPNLAWRQNVDAIDRAFPQNVDEIAAVVEGPSEVLAADAADELAKKLKRRKDLFRNVRQPDGGPFFRREGLLLLPLKEVGTATERLRESYPLFAALTHDRSLRGLLAFTRLAIESVSEHRTSPADVAPLLAILSAGCAAVLNRPADVPVPPLDWDAAAVSRASGVHRHFVLTQLVLNEGAQTPARSLAVIRASARELGLTPDHGYRVRLAGQVALNTEQIQFLQSGLLFRLTVSLALLLGVLFAALRAFRLVAATVATVLVGLIATAAFAAATVGELNLISMVFGVVFCGLSVDFAIQFGIAFRAARVGTDSTGQALTTAGGRVGRPIMFAAAAAASGFFAFLPTAFRGVAELGLIAGGGMLIAAPLTLTLLPALYSRLAPKTVTPPRSGAAWAGRLDAFLQRRRRAVLVCATVLAVLAAALLSRLRFDADPINLIDPRAETVMTFRDLAKDPNNSPYEVDVLAPSLAAAQGLAERLEALPEVDHTVTLATFVPSDQDAKLELIHDLADTLTEGLAVAGADRESPPDAAAQRQAVQWMIQALDQAAPELRRNSPLREQLAAVVAAGDQRVAQLEAVLLPDPLASMAGAQEILKATPVTLASLPEELRSEWLASDGQAKISVFPKGDASDPAICTPFVRAVLHVAPNAVGTPIQFTGAARTIVSAFVLAGTYAVVTILLLVGIALRHVLDTVLVLGPLLLAGLFALATMAALGLALDFANVIALPLLLGIGVAFDIYVVANWRAGERHPLASPTARAVFFSALATGSAFGSLALWPYPGTAHMGLLLAIEVAWVLACTLVVLPALLACIHRE